MGATGRTVPRALLAQLAPSPGSPEANARRAAEIITASDADYVIFPELYVSGYDLERVSEMAVAVGSAAIGVIRTAAAASGTAVAVGFAELTGQSAANATLANAVALIDERGELAAVYRKVQLFGDELDVFEPGEELLVAVLKGRRVGPLVCFDMEFPEHARALARDGAELLLTVAANMEPFYGDHLIASQARALDNRLPHLYCNRCGEEAGLRFVGGSRVLRADGTITAEASRDTEELLAVDLPEREGTDERVDYLRQLREDIGVRAPTTVIGGSA